MEETGPYKKQVECILQYRKELGKLDRKVLNVKLCVGEKGSMCSELSHPPFYHFLFTIYFVFDTNFHFQKQYVIISYSITSFLFLQGDGLCYKLCCLCAWSYIFILMSHDLWHKTQYDYFDQNLNKKYDSED